MLSATTDAQQSVETLKIHALDLLQPLIKTKIISQEKVTTSIDAAASMVSQQAKAGARKEALTLFAISILSSGVAAILGIIAIAQLRKRG